MARYVHKLGAHAAEVTGNVTGSGGDRELRLLEGLRHEPAHLDVGVVGVEQLAEERRREERRGRVVDDRLPADGEKAAPHDRLPERCALAAVEDDELEVRPLGDVSTGGFVFAATCFNFAVGSPAICAPAAAAAATRESVGGACFFIKVCTSNPVSLFSDSSMTSRSSAVMEELL